MAWELSDLKVLLRVGILLILGSAVLNCSGSQETIRKDLPQQNPAAAGRYDESFDPLTLQDDDLVITADSVQTSRGSGESSSILPTQSAIPNEAEGFRVQIMATNNIGTASLTEQEATARFSSQGFKVYLVFEAPLYKIRVGDCLERNAAEELRDKAKDFGYGGAFVVKSKINLSN
jgi:SPOR domain